MAVAGAGPWLGCASRPWHFWIPSVKCYNTAMSLIDCPECGIEVSAQATFCPRCGFPVKKAGGRAPANAQGLPTIPLTSLDVTKSLIGRLVFGGLLLASGIGFDAPPVVMLALVAWGSGVPIYLKARKAARIGAGPGLPGIDEELTRQLLEAKNQGLQQLSDIDRNATRIAELEERLEFMERLLARQRDEG